MGSQVSINTNDKEQQLKKASKMSLKDTLNKRDFRNYKKLSSNGMNRLKCKKK